MSYQGRGGAAPGPWQHRRTALQPGRDTGDSPKPPPAPARGPGKGSATVTSRCTPGALSQPGKNISSLLRSRSALPGAGPVPPVPMEKDFYHKHLVNSCRRSPFPAGPAFIRRESIRKNKHSSSLCTHGPGPPALAGCAWQTGGSQMVPGAGAGGHSPKPGCGAAGEPRRTQQPLQRDSPFSLPQHRDASPGTNPAGADLKFKLQGFRLPTPASSEGCKAEL